MELVIEPTETPLAADAHGVVRIGATRVTLETVVHSFLDGATAEEIALQYPALRLADVYATVTYYLQRQAQVDSYLRQREILASQVQTRIETEHDPANLRARLLARRHNTL